jgi:hypothetical protein
MLSIDFAITLLLLKKQSSDFFNRPSQQHQQFLQSVTRKEKNSMLTPSINFTTIAILQPC